MKKSICVYLLTALLALLGCTAAQEAPQRTVTGIEVDASQAKYWYLSGQEIDPTGLVVTAVYDDGSREPIPTADCEYQKPPFAPAGEKIVAVTYADQEASYPIYTLPSSMETEEYKTYQIRINENKSPVTLTPVLVGENKPFVLVCPGGGYEACSPYGNEGYAYAARIKELGYNAIILQYSINMPHPTPLDDVNLALEIIAENREYW